VKKPAPFVPDEVKPDVPVEEGEEVVALEDAEEVVVEADADETFLEPEEESSDVSGIIDAPVDDADDAQSGPGADEERRESCGSTRRP